MLLRYDALLCRTVGYPDHPVRATVQQLPSALHYPGQGGDWSSYNSSIKPSPLTGYFQCSPDCYPKVLALLFLTFSDCSELPHPSNLSLLIGWAYRQDFL